MKKLQHKIIGGLLAASALFVGVASYIGLNGMGYHKLMERQESGTVHFWYTNDLLTNYYNNVASVYNQLHRGANVVPKLVSASEYLENIYQASIQGEEYPDMYVITSDAMEKAYLAGLTMPVEAEEKVAHAFPNVAVEAASYEDTLLGYPFYFDTSTLVYNKTMLEAVAWDQFRIQAAAEGVENPESIVVPEEDIARLVNVMIPETIDELITLSNNLEAPEGLETVFKWNINDIFFNYFYLGEYATLTDIITHSWSGLHTKEYKQLKGLKKESLRDNMTNVELALNILAEASTTELSKQKNPKGFKQNMAIAQKGGSVAKAARVQLESQLGRSVISKSKASDFLPPLTEDK